MRGACWSGSTKDGAAGQTPVAPDAPIQTRTRLPHHRQALALVSSSLRSSSAAASSWKLPLEGPKRQGPAGQQARDRLIQDRDKVTPCPLPVLWSICLRNAIIA